jgi:hypothetical protein
MWRGGWRRCSWSHRKRRRGESDREMQREVLAIVLREHPSPVTLFDLEHELLRGERGMAAAFALARAAVALGVAGLVYSNGFKIGATPAARHFAWLVL